MTIEAEMSSCAGTDSEDVRYYLLSRTRVVDGAGTSLYVWKTVSTVAAQNE